MSDTPPGDVDEVLHVADNVDEFVERTRLKQIHEAKSAAAEALRAARMQKYDRHAEPADQTTAREHARGAVEGYILELEAVYKRTERGRELWRDAVLGTVPLPEAAAVDITPADIEEIVDIQTSSPLPTVDGEIIVEGVGTYVDGLSGQIEITVSETTASVNPAATGDAPRRGPLTAPVWLSREAYRATNALLANSDIGVKLLDGDEGEADWDTSYRDEE